MRSWSVGRIAIILSLVALWQFAGVASSSAAAAPSIPPHHQGCVPGYDYQQTGFSTPFFGTGTIHWGYNANDPAPVSISVTLSNQTSVSYTITNGSSVNIGVSLPFLQAMAQASGGLATSIQKSDTTTIGDSMTIPKGLYGEIQLGNTMEWVSSNFQYVNVDCRTTEQWSLAAALLPAVQGPGTGNKVERNLVVPFPQSTCVANCSYTPWVQAP